MIRAFFAIDLPQEMQDSIQHMSEQINTHNKLAIQWIKPRNLHVTLQFIKKIELHDITTLIKNAHQELQDIPPFEIELSHLELFPNSVQPRLISIALTSVDILTDIAKRIGQAILTTHYPIESRPYRAHLTIGRFNQTPPENISFKNVELPQNKKFLVREVIFYQSNLSHEGSYYNPLDRIRLTGS